MLRITAVKGVKVKTLDEALTREALSLITLAMKKERSVYYFSPVSRLGHVLAINLRDVRAFVSG